MGLEISHPRSRPGQAGQAQFEAPVSCEDRPFFSTFEEISTLFKSVKAILRARSGANSAIMSENPDDVDLEDGDEDLEEESPNKRARTE
jgi:hypothetical protein